MEKNYLYNLYKNLNLYNKNININNDDINIFTNNVLKGGTNTYYTTVFLQLFSKIKHELQNRDQNMNINEIAIRMRTYSVLLEIYNSYLNQLIQDQENAKTKINEAIRLANSSNLTQIEQEITGINMIFDTLLGITSTPSTPSSPISTGVLSSPSVPSAPITSSSSGASSASSASSVPSVPSVPSGP